MRVSNSPITNFVNGDMSGNLTSPEIQLNQVYGWSAQFVFTGSPVGTLKVQVSDDPSYVAEGTTPVPTHWTDLANSSQSISAAGDITYNANIAFYNWIRFQYVFTSGTGTISGRCNLKGY